MQRRKFNFSTAVRLVVRVYENIGIRAHSLYLLHAWMTTNQIKEEEKNRKIKALRCNVNIQEYQMITTTINQNKKKQQPQRI